MRGGRAGAGWGGGRGASGAAGSHAPRPSPGHARGWQRLPPLGARVPRRPGPGAPTCARRRRAPVPRGAPCRERRAGRRWLLLSVTVSWSRCRFVLRLARTRRAPRCSRRGCRGVCQYSADGLYGSSIRDVRSQGQRLQADGAEFCGGPWAEAPCSEAARFPNRSRPCVHSFATVARSTGWGSAV